MVNRRNYQRVCEYLDYLAQVSQLDPRSVERYRFYLRHLLLWADETLLGEVASIRPGFPHFLSTVHIGDADGKNENMVSYYSFLQLVSNYLQKSCCGVY